MTNERRQLPRWEIRKQAKLWLQQSQSFTQCTLEDLHLKGMRVSCDKELFHQPVVTMAFCLGESIDLMKIEAEIPWSRQEGETYVYGFSFTKISEFDKEKIYEYISNHCSEQFKIKWWSVT